MSKEQAVRRSCLWAALLALVMVQAAWAAGNITIDDPDGLLGGRRGEVEAAARRLADEGADVVVMAVRNSNTPNAEAYIDRRLREIGIGGSTKGLVGNTVLFYRSPDTGQTALYYVPGFKSKLDPAKNAIFEKQMRPLLTSGDTAGGLVAGIDAVRTTLNPPTSPFTYVLIGGVVLGGLALVLGPQLSKRRVAAARLGDARSRMEAARRAAGVAIADLGPVVRTAREKAQYDRLSYTPADVQHLTELQTTGEQLFAEAQVAFDQAEQQQRNIQTPTADGYEQVTAMFGKAQALVEQASTSIREAEQRRVALDQAGDALDPATGATTRL